MDVLEIPWNSCKPLAEQAEEYSEPCETTKAEFFQKIANSWKQRAIFAKSSILDVWQGSEYAWVVNNFFLEHFLGFFLLDQLFLNVRLSVIIHGRRNVFLKRLIGSDVILKFYLKNWEINYNVFVSAEAATGGVL